MWPLRALAAAGHDIAGVVTGADRRRGRGSELSPSPVKRAALELGIPLLVNVADVTQVGAELGVVVAFGRLVKPDVLDRLPMVNLHFSLLPRWRGAAPVERALLAGDKRTGVCLMALEEGLDTGPVYGCVETPIGPRETAAALAERLSLLGTELLVERLSDLPVSLGSPAPQKGESTYAAKLDPGELHIDWTATATAIDRLVRVGRAWTLFRGKRLIVVRAEPLGGDGGSPAEGLPLASLPPAGLPVGSLKGELVATGGGWLQLLEVQPEGKPSMAADEWARGARPQQGELLG